MIIIWEGNGSLRKRSLVTLVMVLGEPVGSSLGWDTNRSPPSPTHRHRQVLDEEDRKKGWKAHGVAFGTFTIRAGDAYVIPAGVPHEFRNDLPSLSIAWNFLQPGAQANLLGLALTDIALTDVYKRYPYKRSEVANPGRNEFIEHGPLDLVASRCTPAADAAADARVAFGHRSASTLDDLKL